MLRHSIQGAGDPLDAKPRILIVDDEADFLFSASVALRQAGYEVVEAADGGEALSRTREFLRAGKRFDLLLTDLRMPSLCGLELLEGLEQLGVEIPVIVMTGYCDDALREDLERKGCIEFLEKPFEPHDLVKQVKKVLESFAYEGKGT
jgi:two-component system chemotaxis response regulator CheY